MAAAVTLELARYGPHAPPAERPALAAAQAYCRRLARTHYENFSVASWLFPRSLRQHLANLYSWCRWADDLADETGDPGRSLQLLDWWEAELDRGLAGQSTHPVLVAVAETIQQFRLPRQEFLDLLDAFRQDQRQTRYATFHDLLGYCRRSANPVGRLVLRLGGPADDEQLGWSDSLCTGLQLANFWQDVAGDLDRGRIYLPQADLARFGCQDQLPQRVYNAAFRDLMEWEVQRAQSYLDDSQPLVARAAPPLRRPVRVFLAGGNAILAAIRRQEYDVWRRRPRVSRWTKACILLRAWWTLP